jgi:hypothetical protein
VGFFFSDSVPLEMEAAAQNCESENAEARSGLLRWPRLSEQFFRVDKWSICHG